MKSVSSDVLWEDTLFVSDYVVFQQSCQFSCIPGHIIVEVWQRMNGTGGFPDFSKK
jgi:hypothetical protein